MMNSVLHTLFALGLCATVSTVSVPASAAPKPAATPELQVSNKKKAAALCREVTASPVFKKARRQAVETKALSHQQSNDIATEVCQFVAATPESRARYWEVSLSKLVEQGKLTQSDKTLLTEALVNPKVLESWKPVTPFGQQVLSNAPGPDDGATYEANSGAGWVIGGIIGGIAGGLMTVGNPAGIGAGIAVGGAVGSLAETVFSGDDDEGGSSGGDSK